MKQTFYLLHKQNIARARQQESTFLEAFLSVPGCQTCMRNYYKHKMQKSRLVDLIIQHANEPHDVVRVRRRSGWLERPPRSR